MSTSPDDPYRADTTTDHDTAAAVHTPPTTEPGQSTDPGPTHGAITTRQKERFGGIKWGSAFFGWLTAVGTAVLLTVLVAAAGVALGMAWADDLDQATQNGDAAESLGIVGAIVVAVLLLIAYY